MNEIKIGFENKRNKPIKVFKSGMYFYTIVPNFWQKIWNNQNNILLKIVNTHPTLLLGYEK